MSEAKVRHFAADCDRGSKLGIPARLEPCWGSMGMNRSNLRCLKWLSTTA